MLLEAAARRAERRHLGVAAGRCAERHRLAVGRVGGGDVEPLAIGEHPVAAGAQIIGTADDVWAEADLVLKVKEPVASEYHRMRSDQVLFTYLHLAASRECTDALLASGTTAVAYETVQLPDRSLP
ncbi:MAG: hypothetical protein KY464_17835, partial [Gemmatimonadetes bacterium]|nr:hypothetical protein [Gemmatimonadota bacterium]